MHTVAKYYLLVALLVLTLDLHANVYGPLWHGTSSINFFRFVLLVAGSDRQAKLGLFCGRDLNDFGLYVTVH